MAGKAEKICLSYARSHIIITMILDSLVWANILIAMDHIMSAPSSTACSKGKEPCMSKEASLLATGRWAN
jgi:hypothetical protein